MENSSLRAAFEQAELAALLQAAASDREDIGRSRAFSAFAFAVL